MKSKNRSITIAVFILFISSFFPVAFAEIKEVEIGIDGLSCPFCVWGLKKQMKSIEAIEKLDISLKKSVASITLKGKSMLNVQDYKDAVKKAGFSVREIKIFADGRIVTYGDFLALNIPETNQLFILSHAKELKVGTKVVIKGNVHEHAEGEHYGLSVERIELTKE